MCTLWISQIHLLLMFMYVYICYVETLIIIFFIQKMDIYCSKCVLHWKHRPTLFDVFLSWSVFCCSHTNKSSLVSQELVLSEHYHKIILF